MGKRWLTAAVAASMMTMGAGPAPSRYARVDEARLLAAENEPGNWMSYGRTYSEQRFSPLKRIDTSNVGRLGLAWFADFDTNRGQEATPIVVDGVLYVSTAWSKVKAYDARTGKPLWAFDPKVPGEWGAFACCDVVNRGVAAWKGKIYVGTIDGRLIAIDARTGKQLWETNTIDKTKPYSITGAPRVVKGKVLIGNGGAEYGVRGYVTAYDAETGKQAWRFYTVPGDPAKGFETPELERAAKTWEGEYWRLGGGGTVWDAITYDPKTDLVYIGVGNGSPWNAEYRSRSKGDNLFLSSIVAVRPDTGAYVWHYQTVNRETWDYTATQPIMTADLTIDGQPRHVVMQAPKNGFFYVLDAATGKLISAKNIVAVNWASGIDMATGRPIENPYARFEVSGKPAAVLPGAGGAHSWHPWSYSPLTGLVYIPAMEVNMSYANPKAFKISERAVNFGVEYTFTKTPGSGYDGEGAPAVRNEGFLLAWDPVNQKEVWRVPFGERGRGGGALATAGGLVFQGNSARQEFAVYRADNGEKLWSMPAQTGIVAGPVSYEVGGEQYVAVSAGNNQSNYYSSNHSRILVFKLGGKAKLPPAAPPVPPPAFDPPDEVQPAAVVAQGAETYARLCSQCHGAEARNNGNFPDLRRSGALKNEPLFQAIVLKGALSRNGMGSFAHALDTNSAAALRAYLIAQSQAAKANPPPPAPF
jgi:alcohol dehydrogenase (cytochrome c)/quinohemoprotein ethanol dehydrogenase